MTRLVKSDLYKFKRLNIFWIGVIFIVLLFAVVPFTNHADSSESFFLQKMDTTSAAIMMLPMFSCFLVGRGYHQRTAMYEVMAGNSHVRIMISKLLSVALTVTLIAFLSGLGGLAVATGMDSTGIREVLQKEALFFLVLLRAVSASVLLTLCVRHIGSIGLIYMRGILEMIIMLIASAVTENDYLMDSADMVTITIEKSPFLDLLLMQQPMLLLRPLTGYEVREIILGLVIETLIWIILYFMIVKKRDY